MTPFPSLTDLVGVRMAGPLLHCSVGGDRHPYCATGPQISAQGDSQVIKGRQKNSVADPNFFHPGSRIQIFSIPDPGSSVKKIPGPRIRTASKNSSILTQKIVSKLSEIRIRILIFTHPGSKIQGSKMQRLLDPDPQHCKKVYRKKAHQLFF